MIISLSSGYRSNHQVEVDKVGEALKKELEENEFSVAPLINLKLQFTQIANSFYYPLHHKVINVYSGEGDAITYPILLVLFALLFFILNKRLEKQTKGEKAIVYFLLLYWFFVVNSRVGSDMVWNLVLSCWIGIYSGGYQK